MLIKPIVNRESSLWGCTTKLTNIIEISIWPRTISESQELQFFDKGKRCLNIPLQWEMTRPINHIPERREHACLVQTPEKKNHIIIVFFFQWKLIAYITVYPLKLQLISQFFLMACHAALWILQHTGVVLSGVCCNCTTLFYVNQTKLKGTGSEERETIAKEQQLEVWQKLWCQIWRKVSGVDAPGKKEFKGRIKEGKKDLRRVLLGAGEMWRAQLQA